MSKDNLENDIQRISKDLDYLEKIKNQGKEQFLENPEKIKAVKYSLKGVMDGCLTLTKQTVMSGKITTVGSYIDMFEKLKEKNVVDDDLSKKIIEVIRLRTKFNPFEGEVTDDEVWEILDDYLPHIKTFVENIKEFNDQ